MQKQKNLLFKIAPYSLLQKYLTSKAAVWFTLFCIVLLVRSFSVLPPESAADAVNKWHGAFYIVENGDWHRFVDNHHRARWGVILPAMLTQTYIRSGLVSFHLPQLIFYSLLFVTLISVVEKTKMRSAIMLFVIFLYFEPTMFRASSQLQPFVFGQLAILWGAICAVKYVKSSSHIWLFTAALCTFFAYGAKETYAYFWPGILFFVYLHEGLKPVVLLGITWLSLLFLECLIFNWLSDWNLAFGRWQVILQGQHFPTRAPTLARLGYSEYFTRWLHLPIYNLIIIALWPIAVFWKFFSGIKMKRSALIQAVFFCVLSYVLSDTFLITSINPIGTAQLPYARYLTPIIPLLFLIVFLEVTDILMILKKSHVRISKLWTMTVVTVLAIAASLYSPYEYTGREYKRFSLYLWKSAEAERNLLSILEDGNRIVFDKNNMGLWSMLIRLSRRNGTPLEYDIDSISLMSRAQDTPKNCYSADLYFELQVEKTVCRTTSLKPG